MRTYTIVIERDAEAVGFVGHVPGWPGAHSQGDSIAELQENMAEVLAMLLEDGEPELTRIRRHPQRERGVSARIPVLKPYQVVRALESLGFYEVRQRGEHKQFRHVDGRGTTVPFHKGKDIKPALLRQIGRDIGVSVETLVKAS